MADLLEPGGVLVRFLIMFLIILMIFAVLVWLIGRLSSLRMSSFARRNKQHRLEVIDAVQVDNRRRAILLRRDNVEHLILVGGPGDIVVEHRPLDDERQKPASQRAESMEQATDRPRPQPANDQRTAERREAQRSQAKPQPARQRPASRREAASPRPALEHSPADAVEPPVSRRDVAFFGGEAPMTRPRRPIETADQSPAPPHRPAPPPEQSGAPAADPYAKPPRNTGATPIAYATPNAWDDEVVLNPTLEPAAHAAIEEEEEAAAEFVAAAAPPPREDQRRPTSDPMADLIAAVSPPPPTSAQAAREVPPRTREDRPVRAGRNDQDFDFQPAPPPPASRREPALQPVAAPAVRPQRHDDDDDVSSAERVGRLEEEMARLLSEITTKRRSGT